MESNLKKENLEMKKIIFLEMGKIIIYYDPYKKTLEMYKDGKFSVLSSNIEKMIGLQHITFYYRNELIWGCMLNEKCILFRENRMRIEQIENPENIIEEINIQKIIDEKNFKIISCKSSKHKIIQCVLIGDYGFMRDIKWNLKIQLAYDLNERKIILIDENYVILDRKRIENNVLKKSKIGVDFLLLSLKKMECNLNIQGKNYYGFNYGLNTTSHVFLKQEKGEMIKVTPIEECEIMKYLKKKEK